MSLTEEMYQQLEGQMKETGLPSIQETIRHLLAILLGPQITYTTPRPTGK